MSLIKIHLAYTEYRDKAVREFGYNMFIKALSLFVTENADDQDIAIAAKLAYRHLTEQRQFDCAS
mgnify:CR=1 FL=1|tara:strand:- start:3172 stop:3366 length:195 start_codon:yes stop_codon:yes gene_type:complete